MRTTSKTDIQDSMTSWEEEGEIGQLKKQYGDSIPTLKEMFPEWTDEDLVFALKETDGDLADTVERITEGMFLASTSLHNAFTMANHD